MRHIITQIPNPKDTPRVHRWAMIKLSDILWLLHVSLPPAACCDAKRLYSLLRASSSSGARDGRPAPWHQGHTFVHFSALSH